LPTQLLSQPPYPPSPRPHLLHPHAIIRLLPPPTPPLHSTHTTSQIRAAHRAVSTEMNTVLLRVGSRGLVVDPDDLGGKRSCSAPMIRSPAKGKGKGKGGCRASGAEEML